MINLKKVILIGGSPMVGKSTVAAATASKLPYSCVSVISTDDIGEILLTVSDIDPMKGQNYLEYYAHSPKKKLIGDITEYHRKLEPAICRLIDIHSTWGNPLIMEGYALYPELMGKINSDNVFSVWLIAGDGLLEKRMKARKSFYQDAKEPEKAIENYLYRSEWHNRKIFEECKAEKQKYITVNEDSAAQDIAAMIMENLSINE